MLNKDVVRGDLPDFCFDGKALDGSDEVKEKAHGVRTLLCHLKRWQLRLYHRTIIASSIPIHRKCVSSLQTSIRTSNHLLHSETMGLIVNEGGKSLREAMRASLASSKVEVDELLEKGSGVMSRFPHRLSRFNAAPLVGSFCLETRNKVQKIKEQIVTYVR